MTALLWRASEWSARRRFERRLSRRFPLMKSTRAVSLRPTPMISRCIASVRVFELTAPRSLASEAAAVGRERFDVFLVDERNVTPVERDTWPTGAVDVRAAVRLAHLVVPRQGVALVVEPSGSRPASLFPSDLPADGAVRRAHRALDAHFAPLSLAGVCVWLRASVIASSALMRRAGSNSSNTPA